MQKPNSNFNIVYLLQIKSIEAGSLIYNLK